MLAEGARNQQADFTDLGALLLDYMHTGKPR